MSFGFERDIVLDAIHDVFLHIFEHKKNLCEQDYHKFYLFRCLKNRLISLDRKQINFDNINNLNDDYKFSVQITDLDLIIEEEEKKELIDKVNEMLRYLTDRQREAIYLYFSQELDYEEVAALLNMTTKGARKLIYRAIERIRERHGSAFLLLFILKNTLPDEFPG